MEEEEKDSLKRNVFLYNGKKEKSASVSFLWGSPLHKMIDPEEPGPYDIVELSENNLEATYRTAEEHLPRSKEHTPSTSPTNVLKHIEHREDMQNTFSQFGYNLPDIDTSDEEEVGVKPLNNGDIKGTQSHNFFRTHSWSLEGIKLPDGRINFNETLCYERDHNNLQDTECITQEQTTKQLIETSNKQSIAYLKDKAMTTENAKETNVPGKISIHSDHRSANKMDKNNADAYTSNHPGGNCQNIYENRTVNDTKDESHSSKILQLGNGSRDDRQKLHTLTSTRTETNIPKKVMNDNTNAIEQTLVGDPIELLEEAGQEQIQNTQKDMTDYRMQTTNMSLENGNYNQRKISKATVVTHAELITKDNSGITNQGSTSPLSSAIGNQTKLSEISYIFNETEEVEQQASVNNDKLKDSHQNDVANIKTNQNNIYLRRYSEDKSCSDYSVHSSFHQNIKPKIAENRLNQSLNIGTKSDIKAIKKEFDNSLQLFTDLCSSGPAKLTALNADNTNMACLKEAKTSPTALESNISENKLHNIESHKERENVNHSENDDEQNKYWNKTDDFSVRHFSMDNKQGYIYTQAENLQYHKSAHSFETRENILSRYTSECQNLELSRPTGSNIPYIKQNLTQDNPKHTESSYPDTKDLTTSSMSFEMHANIPWSTSSRNKQSWTSTQGHWGDQQRVPRSQWNSQPSQSAKYNSWNSPGLHGGNENPLGEDSYQPLDIDERQDFASKHSGSWQTDPSKRFNSDNKQGSWNQQSEILQYPEESQELRFRESRSPSSNSTLARSSGSTSSLSNIRFPSGRRSWHIHTGEDDCDCTNCFIKQHLRILTEYMESIGYEVKNVSGDGNCLFAAVVDQLKINGDFSYSADSLRQKSVQYLRKRPHVEDGTHLEAFLANETWEEYLERMEEDGEWGDDIVLRGISEMTGRRIIVYSSFMSKTVLTPTEVFEKEDLFIGHIKNIMHFVSLRPKFWDVIWPIRIIYRRQSALLDKMRLGSTMFDSLRSSAEESLNTLTELMNTGDVNGSFKLLKEIKQMLEKKSDIHQELLISEETSDTMDTLIRDKFSVDMISGTPMLHLTFLIKLLIETKLFRSGFTEFENLFDKHKYILSRIGCSALGLNTPLMDFTAAMQNFSMFEKKAKEVQPESITFVLKPPKCEYEINEVKSAITDNCLIIDDTDTSPGYIRLRPINTALWAGCVEWFSPQESFLRGLKVTYMPKDSYRDFTKFSVKQLEGLECSFWPKQAGAWINRKSPSGWPSEENIQEASGKGCLIIRRAHEFSEYPDIEWQFIFNEAEKVLVESFTEPMIYGFRVFKALVGHQTRNYKVRLNTYNLLTTMFYCSEIIPVESWSTNVGGCILFLVAWLLRQVRIGDIPHYFIPENNMIDHYDENDLKSIEYSLQALRCFPFASIYFLLESHSFMYLHVIDQIESSIEEYKLSKNKHQTVEKVFIPIAFKLACHQLKCKVLPFYKSALDYIEHGYEQTVGLADEENIPTFEQFVLTFLTSVHDAGVKLTFAQVVDQVKKTELSKLLLKNKPSQRISDILGEEYTGEWSHVYMNVSDDKWNAIYEFTGILYTGYENEECAEILRCSISALQKELKRDNNDYDEIEDENIKKQLTASNYRHVYFIVRYLVTFYKHLSKCYEAMDRLELFQEHIHDYEEIARRIDSYMHYETLSKIYRQLGDRDKANQLEEKVEALKPKGKAPGTIVFLLR